MASTFYAAGYWGNRKESAGMCARRLANFLLDIRDSNELLARWHAKGRSEVEALKNPVQADVFAFRSLLSPGESLIGSGEAEFEELGYSAAIWNGRETAVDLRVTCGAFPPRPSVMNHCLLNLPDRGDGRAMDLYRVETTSWLMKALAADWYADWATLASHDLRKEQDLAPREPVIGWITFLGASRKVPENAAPPGVAVEDVAGGTLLRIGEDPRAVDVGIVMRLRKVLALSGSLAPTP